MSVDAIRYRVIEFIKNVRSEETNYSFKGKIKSEILKYENQVIYQKDLKKLIVMKYQIFILH